MSEDLKGELKTVYEFLDTFETSIDSQDVRSKVVRLIPVVDKIREIGKALVPEGLNSSARDRILRYFLLYPRTVINEKEIAVIAGISEWARRVRELRVQFGWKIFSGITTKSMLIDDEEGKLFEKVRGMGADDYILLEEEPDRRAAYRWNLANEMRKSRRGMREKILEYFRKNVGEHITGEELRYIAKGTEWARRVRELRTEYGWPISTKFSGNPTLPIGVYVLERDSRAPKHDRNISDQMRRNVLKRDGYTCRKCGWSYDVWNPSDPRFLEVHHIIGHAVGGENTEENLISYCNVCHDLVHKLDIKG